MKEVFRLMKKYIAEFIGTFTLVFVGCGTAMLKGCDADMGCGYLLTALAFGLAIVAMAYSIGNISGCHINPAVSLAVLINKGMDVKDFALYLVAQFLGATAGSAVLALIFKWGNLYDMTMSYGEKVYAFGVNNLNGVSASVLAGLASEIILTFIFVMAILGVTSKKAGHGSFGGIVIGLTLVLVHIVGIGLTGTSVNPARSFGPAIVALISGYADPIKCVWIFFVGPLAGAALAAVVYKFLENDSKKEEVAE